MREASVWAVIAVPASHPWWKERVRESRCSVVHCDINGGEAEMPAAVPRHWLGALSTSVRYFILLTIPSFVKLPLA